MDDRRRFLRCLIALAATVAVPAHANSTRIHECLRTATTQMEKDRCRRLPRGSGDK